jgi:hypothetical protein
MGVNIDEILASLEQEKTAEANFAEGLSNDSTPESTEEKTEAVSEDNAPAETPEESTKEASAEEAAEEVSEEPSETVEVSEDDIEKVAAECDAKGRVMARAFVAELNKLAADADNDESVSETSEPVSEETVQAEETNSAEEPAEKTAEDSAAHIVGSLYNNFFGGEE